DRHRGVVGRPRARMACCTEPGDQRQAQHRDRAHPSSRAGTLIERRATWLLRFAPKSIFPSPMLVEIACDGGYTDIRSLGWRSLVGSRRLGGCAVERFSAEGPAPMPGPREAAPALPRNPTGRVAELGDVAGRARGT